MGPMIKSKSVLPHGNPCVCPYRVKSVGDKKCDVARRLLARSLARVPSLCVERGRPPRARERVSEVGGELTACLAASQSFYATYLYVYKL